MYVPLVFMTPENSDRRGKLMPMGGGAGKEASRDLPRLGQVHYSGKRMLRSIPREHPLSGASITQQR